MSRLGVGCQCGGERGGAYIPHAAVTQADLPELGKRHHRRRQLDARRISHARVGAAEM